MLDVFRQDHRYQQCWPTDEGMIYNSKSYTQECQHYNQRSDVMYAVNSYCADDLI